MATAHNLEESVPTETTDRTSDLSSNPAYDEVYTVVYDRGDPQQEPTVFNIPSEPSRPGTVDSNTLELMLDQATQTFVPTSSFEHIRRSLEKDCQVTICGASGEGKTTMALMLGQKYRKKGYELVFVNRLDVFDLGSCITSGQKFFLIFDDIFGSEGQFKDHTHIQALCNSLKLHIEQGTRERDFRPDDIGQGFGPVEAIKKGGPDKKKPSQALRVVFTAKTYNLEEGMALMQYQHLSLFNGKTTVDLTVDTSYSHKEKKTIFQKHRELHPKNCPGDFVIEDVINPKPPLFGFPLTCRLFFEFPKFTGKAVDFFQRPLYYLRIALNDILGRRNDQAAALILVLLCEENIKLPELESPNINKKVDEMFMYVTSYANSASRSSTAAAARSFRGTFLSRGDSLCFAHSSIYEACACALYHFNPSFVLQYCSLDFLYERLKPGYRDHEESGVSDNLHYLFVSEEYYNIVITRLITSMRQGIFSKTVAHPMNENDSFVEKLLKELGKTASENKDWIWKKDKGRGFLYWIVRSKSTKLIQCIEEVLLINFTQGDISEALFAAVECDKLPILKHLVERLEHNLDETDLNKLLLVSAESSSNEVVSYLLKMGAQITGTDTNNRNILHLLCIHDRSMLLKAIIDLCGDTSEVLQCARSALDKDKRTPIMLAALHGTLDCLKQLQYEDMDDSSDSNGDHLIHLACHCGNIDIVDRVLTDGNINTRGQIGMTPLMAAASKARLQVFNLLLSKNADTEVVDDNGNTLLHQACIGGSKHIVERLVTQENINNKNKVGKTPSMFAANRAQSEVFDLLLSQNAETECVDEDGNRLLHHACIGGSTHIIERLLTNETINTKGMFGMTPIMFAAIRAQSETFDQLSSKKADREDADDNGNTLLHHACLGGSKHIVERLVTNENINTKNKVGNTPIMFAAFKAKSEVFDLMLSQNADIEDVDNYRNTLLHYACIRGSKHIVKHLLTPENINTKGKVGKTPIMFAAKSAQSEVFDLLLSKNACIGNVDNYGNTLLHHACIGGSKLIVERLVTPENINTKGKVGMTPIMYAANRAQSEVFDLLLSKNAETEYVDEDGNTLLHHACIGGSKLIVERLVTPENINTKGKVGMTPIMYAANRAQSEVFDLLLSKNAETEDVDEDGNTLLHHACIGGSKHIVEHLVTPENINTKGKVGMTPIMYAANRAKSEVFDLLLSKNAEIEGVDDDGNTLLHHACVGGSKHIVEHLVTPENINTKGKVGETPIMFAALRAKSEVFDLLLSKNADIEDVDEDGNTLLHHACMGGSKRIVKHLLTPENINIRGRVGMTPIMDAANRAQSEVFDLLLSKNADREDVDDYGNTLLHHACIGGSKHIVEHLVTPENINTKGKVGMTPIMYAANRAQSEVFDLLLSKNADREDVDEDGNTLLHHACMGGSTHIVERLVTLENINTKGAVGMTPIMFAANRAQSEVFDLLLSKNAETEDVDDYGNTLLHQACGGGNKHIVERLVTPENINTKIWDGRTPIMTAANRAQSEVFDLLLSKNAQTEYVDEYGNTLLHHACMGGSKHIVERLVTPENINIRGKVGMTPIMDAANSAQSEVFDLLLSKNAQTGYVDEFGNTLLHHACIRGSKHIVERLVTPENINTRSSVGITPIIVAAFKANSEVFDLLLSKNADTEYVDEFGNTLLHHACTGGSKLIVERLVTPEIINIGGRVGMTPIMDAAKSAQSEVFDLLLSKNAETEYVDEFGNTLLHHACLGGSKHIVERLVTHENINTKNKFGNTPIMFAAFKAKSEAFDLLLSKKADIEDVDEDINTLLHYACIRGNTHIVKHLVTPENINTKGKVGKTPIMFAAKSAQSEVFDLLLSKNADREDVDEDGNTLLHHACIGGSKHIVEHLVTPENINTKGKVGNTPIMYAANRAQSEVFDLLLSKNADREDVDEDGNTLLHHACMGGSKHIVERLVTPENINIRGRVGMTPIMDAANSAQSEVFDLLLSKNAETEYVDGFGNTLLHHACHGGSKHIVERLVTHENINTKNKFGNTPIMFAAFKAKSEVFDLLLSKNADREDVDEDGNTLLHHACIGGSKHIVERLVTPENINTKGKVGMTPIMFAANSAQSEVFDLLLSKNAETEVVDDNGNTLLHHACHGGSKHIVERIVTHENINTKIWDGTTPIMSLLLKEHIQKCLTYFWQRMLT